MKTSDVDIGITIESTTSNTVNNKCVTTIYNNSNGMLTSGISAFLQLFEKTINNILVLNFLLFSGIRNPIDAITTLSGTLYSANVKLMKTTVLDMRITIESTTSNNVTKKCVTTIYNTANCTLTYGISVFVQLFAQILNNIFVFNFLFFSCIRNPT